MPEHAARRVDLLRLSHRPDPDLQSVVILGENGWTMALGMIVDGSLIRGVVAPKARFSAALDGALQLIADASDGSLALDETLRGVFVRDQESADRKRREGWELLAGRGEGVSVDDLDDTEFRAALPALVPARTFVLADAKLRVDGAWVDIGALQVSVDHVGAWWILDQEAGVRVRYRTDPLDEGAGHS